MIAVLQKRTTHFVHGSRPSATQTYWRLGVVTSASRDGKAHTVSFVSVSTGEMFPWLRRNEIPWDAHSGSATRLTMPPASVIHALGRDEFESLDDVKNALAPYLKAKEGE